METSNHSCCCKGEMTQRIEQKLKSIPSSGFLCVGVGAMAFSFLLKCVGRTHDALFVGQLAGPLFIVGAFKKMEEEKNQEDETRQWE